MYMTLLETTLINLIRFFVLLEFSFMSNTERFRTSCRIVSGNHFRHLNRMRITVITVEMGHPSIIRDGETEASTTVPRTAIIRVASRCAFMTSWATRQPQLPVDRIQHFIELMVSPHHNDSLLWVRLAVFFGRRPMESDNGKLWLHSLDPTGRKDRGGNDTQWRREQNSVDRYGRS